MPYPDVENYVSRAYLSRKQVTYIKLVQQYQETLFGLKPNQHYMDTVNDSKKSKVC